MVIGIIRIQPYSGLSRFNGFIIPILEKGLASITEREKQIIKEKWVDIRFQKQIDWQPVIWQGSSINLLNRNIPSRSARGPACLAEAECCWGKPLALSLMA